MAMLIRPTLSNCPHLRENSQTVVTSL